MKLKFLVEPIAKHPRDYFGVGRVKVQLTDDDGYHMNNEIGTSKRKLYAKMGEVMPKAQEKFDAILS